MRHSTTRWRFAATVGLALLAGPADANTVAPVSPVSCISVTDTCIGVPVGITRGDAVDMRGFSVVLELSANLELCTGPGSITEGTYLSAIGSTDFQVVSNGGGVYTVDGVILGLPCGATAASGTLFNLNLKKAPGPDGTGTVTITSLVLRDCPNAPMTAVIGGPASITIDTAAPGAVTAVAASQVKTGNDADGTTQIAVSWPAQEVGATVDVYRAGYGNHPEYDDAPGAGSVPAIPSYPPGAPWALAGSFTGPTSFADETATRDFYYYVAFVRDACGNQGPVSNLTGGTLNYHLGDASNGVTACAGNNLVTTADISLLGSNYGIALGVSDPLDCLDVGPTTDLSVDARPTTDKVIQFEDLILFAINFGTVSAPQDAQVLAAASVDEIAIDVPALPGVGGTFNVRLPMKAAGDIQGLSVDIGYDAAVVEPLSVAPGELLARQRGAAVLSARPGNMDVALLGIGQGLAGEGVVAEMSFRVKRSGDPGITLARAEARDAANRPVVLGARPVAGAQGISARTGIGTIAPNPFGARTEIQLSLAQGGSANVAIYDLSGRLVKQLINGELSAGTRTLHWDGRGESGTRMPVGFYVLRLQSGSLMQSRSLFLVK